MGILFIFILVCVVNVQCSFGKVLPTEFHTSSSDYEGPWIRYSQPNVEIIPHDPIVERGANLTLRCVAHGIKNLQDYKWKVPFHMLMEPFKLAERDKRRTLEVMHISDKDHGKQFVCEVMNDFGQAWAQTVTLRILELMQPHSTQTVTLFRGRTVNYNNRNSKSEGDKYKSGVGTAIGVGLVMACIGVFIGIFIAVTLIRRRQTSKVPNLDRAATKRHQPGRAAVISDEHYMSLNQPTNISSTASSERYLVDLGLPVYHQKPPALPPPRVVKPIPPSRKRHHKLTANKLHREAMANKSKSMDSVYDTMKRSYQIQEYVKPSELEYGSCEYIDMLANLRNPPLQQTNNNNPRTSLVDTYTTPVELFRDN